VGDTVECKHVCHDNGSIVHHHRFSVDAKVISAPCTVATIISFTTMSSHRSTDSVVRQNTGEHRRAVIRHQRNHSRSIDCFQAVLVGANKVNGPPASCLKPASDPRRGWNSLQHRDQ
jgi:hypothetical protein